MNELEERNLIERVERLEQNVGELRRRFQSISRMPGENPEQEREAPEARTAATSRPAESQPEVRKLEYRRPEPPRPDPTSFAPTGRRQARERAGAGETLRGLTGWLPFGMDDLRSWEWWLNKVGIGLLLFGIAFLFKFSIDQGWLQRILTEPVRVGLGLAIGFSLITIGLRVYEDRRSFSQALLGGGVATLYTTGFAAYGLYGLVPYPLAFGFMVTVTLLAFFLSVRQNEAALSLIGTLGGLGTPFILYTGGSDLGGLVLYASLLLAGTAAVYLLKGWRSLLAVSFTGGWFVLAAGYRGVISQGTPGVNDQVAMQLGIAFAWLLFWLVPVAREVLHSRDSRRWPLPAPGSSPVARIARELLGDAEGFFGNASYAHMLSVSTPLIALVLTRGIWDLSGDAAGWVCFGGAFCYVVVAAALQRMLRRVGGGTGLSYTQALTALMLFTLGLVLILSGNALLFALAAEGAVLHLASRRVSGRVLAVKAHLLFLAAAGWLTGRILVGVFESVLGYGVEPPAFFNADAAADLAVVALAFVASVAVWPRYLERVYRIFGHVALLGWLTRELLLIPNGSDWAFLCWGLYAVGLHLLRGHAPRWGSAALAYVISAFAGLWLLERLVAGSLMPESSSVAILNLQGVLDLAMILLAAATSRLLSSRAASVYRLAAAGAFSLWLFRELYPLPEGSGWVLLTWAIFAFALIPASRRLSDGALLAASHLQFAVSGVLLCRRLVEDLARHGVESPVLLNFEAGINLGAIVLAVLASRKHGDGWVALSYRLVAHVAVLALLWGELWALPGGYAYVTIAWGVYGAGLLVAGLRWDHTQLVRGGMATLFLVVGKLFLVDLTGVEAVWRILLFLGFGGLFLVLSYYLQSLWRPGSGVGGPTRRAS